MKKQKSRKVNNTVGWLENCYGQLKIVNDSKVFAGVMIILLNVATKFVPIRVSKSMEAFLRYTFSRNLLVFAICWVGTRDIIISLCITLIFVILMDFLFNEESRFCILPESFTDYHLSMAETETEKEKEKEKEKDKEKDKEKQQQQQLTQ